MLILLHTGVFTEEHLLKNILGELETFYSLKSQLRRIFSQNYDSLLESLVYIAESCYSIICNIVIITGFL